MPRARATSRVLTHPSPSPSPPAAMRTARVGLNKRNALRQRGSTIRVNSQKDTFPRDWLKKDNFPLYVGFLA